MLHWLHVRVVFPNTTNILYIHVHTFNDPSSKPAAATVPFGDKAHERAHGERWGTSDLSKAFPVLVHHT